MSKPNTRSNRLPPLEVQRLPIRFDSDDRRVIPRPFFPGGEARICRIVERVNQLSESEVRRILGEVFRDFGGRHRDIESVFEEQYEAVVAHTGRPSSISSERRLLIASVGHDRSGGDRAESKCAAPAIGVASGSSREKDDLSSISELSQCRDRLE